MKRRIKVSRIDIGYIGKMAGRGMTADEIGAQLGIANDRVAQFMPKPATKADPPPQQPPKKSKKKKR